MSKKLDLRKSRNTIRNSVGQRIFPWTIFGQAIIAKLTQFSIFIFMGRSSVNYIAVCASLCLQVTENIRHVENSL